MPHSRESVILNSLFPASELSAVVLIVRQVCIDPEARALRRMIVLKKTLRFMRTTGVLVALFMISMTPAGAKEEVNADGNGYAIHGYDPVAYHKQGGPVAGKEKHIFDYEGGRYKFANKQNMEKFQDAPARYAPAYGGWCAYGVRVGKKFDVDPHAFKIINGRLFLQLDQGTQKIWLKDLSKNIAIADRLWPSLEKMSRKMLGE